ncbi:DUF3718 domain-containing protein [Alteromonas sp. 345S023]|uniref:DUF3718 domain-containing protein n=1 Tax=Alteromonas profundi TaxID=2696062 RepID=A0A7X5RJN6_9ALTE|nr:DUF3718 domain-containing protein [Alteromonas profundi]NDV90078.1 DUF3718 domain-containing protein [Alteromonas profundi]
MKLLKTLFATATIACALNANAAGPQKNVRFVGDTQYAGFCKAIVLDDIKVLRSSLSRGVGRIGSSQREVLRMVTSEDGLTCNGVNLLDFAVKREANEVREYLTSRS